MPSWLVQTMTTKMDSLRLCVLVARSECEEGFYKNWNGNQRLEMRVTCCFAWGILNGDFGFTYLAGWAVDNMENALAARGK